MTDRLTAAPIVETERLILRPVRAEDFEGMAELLGSPRSAHIGGPVGRGVAWRRFSALVGSWALLGYGAWAIEVRDSGLCVGLVLLQQPADWPEQEVGWCLWDNAEGKGYASEAALAARRFAYETLGWQTAVSYIGADNQRSIALAERIGAKADPEAVQPEGVDCIVYRHPAPDAPPASQSA